MRAQTKRSAQAHRPSSAMMPAPSTMHPRAYANLPFEACTMSRLKRKSCAISWKAVVRSMCRHKSLADKVHLNETGVQENARAECIKDSADNVRSCAVWVVRLTHAKAGGDANGRGDAVENPADDGHPGIPCREARRCETRADAEALECL